MGILHVMEDDCGRIEFFFLFAMISAVFLTICKPGKKAKNNPRNQCRKGFQAFKAHKSSKIWRKDKG